MLHAVPGAQVQLCLQQRPGRRLQDYLPRPRMHVQVQAAQGRRSSDDGRVPADRCVRTRSVTLSAKNLPIAILIRRCHLRKTGKRLWVPAQPMMVSRDSMQDLGASALPGVARALRAVRCTAAHATKKIVMDWIGRQAPGHARSTRAASTPQASGASAQRVVGVARKLEELDALGSAVPEARPSQNSVAKGMPLSATLAMQSSSVGRTSMDGPWNSDQATTRLLTWKPGERSAMMCPR
mmetsp:Transcript_14616/g.35441  ORF Transcript_14616/g.35441 Transcript_14616/m.35441 type:complete len:238 (+) Transcript_14616:622-1335(+)